MAVLLSKFACLRQATASLSTSVHRSSFEFRRLWNSHQCSLYKGKQSHHSLAVPIGLPSLAKMPRDRCRTRHALGTSFPDCAFRQACSFTSPPKREVNLPTQHNTALTDSFSISLQKWMAFSRKIIGFHSIPADRVL